MIIILGGCGAMYQVIIDSELFKGKRTIQQHKMVNEVRNERVNNLNFYCNSIKLYLLL